MHEKTNRFIGSVLLVAGTTVGAGMLALPATTVFAGFVPSLLLFVFCWLVMLATAYLILDVTLSFKGETNLISMAYKTLGNPGRIVTWVAYLLLLYALTSAYIAASAPLFQRSVLHVFHYEIPLGPTYLLLPLLFGISVYVGTASVDMVNRVLTAALCIAYLLLVSLLPQHIRPARLARADPSGIWIALPVVITSFGYHIVIPGLTTYLHRDRKRLRKALFIGSVIPLLFYVAWQLVVIGVVPVEDLAGVWKAGLSVTGPLARVANSPELTLGAHFFSFFAIVTSFLGVALSLSDFLADGLKLKKGTSHRIAILLLTFVPPLIFVFTYTKGFLVALEYAAVFVAILLIFLPAAMAWSLRGVPFYGTGGGRVYLLSIMLIALTVIATVFSLKAGLSNTITEAHVPFPS
ncbi:MAG: tyrosine transporter [Simkaniaceae bacterium]|nr:tyrosine transporter [Simkaniaceae bacterium]